MSRSWVLMMLCAIALWMSNDAMAQAIDDDDMGAAQEACEDVAEALREACLDAEIAKLERVLIARRAYQGWLADRLVEDGGARNLALAVYLRRSALAMSAAIDEATPSAEKADGLLSAWMDAARADAGHDGVAWSLLASTAGSKGKPHLQGDDIARAWAEAEPDNLTPLLILMRSNDDAETIFASLDSRSRHAIYWGEVQALGLHAVERHPPKAEWRDDIPEFSNDGYEAFGAGLASLLTLPSYQYILAACKPPLIDISDRRAQCHRLGSMLQEDADTLIGNFIGNALLRNSAGSGTERAAAETARNRLRWLQSQAQAYQGPAYEAAYRAALREGSSFNERTLIERTLQAVGAAPEPPDDWVPDVVSPK